ncbi:MAG: pyridoxal phosphate-dependent aminotransferase [Rectinemataceae bacterium]|nr:pyridoxal phosphate-dependent aminotransferase [Rectinemataceae bacterium]
MEFSDRLEWPVRSNPLSLLKADILNRGRVILDFSESNPSRAGLTKPFWSGHSGILAEPAVLDYNPDPRGLLKSREALSTRFSGRGIAICPENVFLGASTSEAYAWIFKLLCDPGDSILVPKPGYPLFDFLAGLEAVHVLPYRLEYTHPSGWSIDIDALKTLLERESPGRVKAIVLINPNNPTGSYVRQAERDALLDLCSHYGLAIISDEVFFDFSLEAREERRSFAGEERVLTFTLDGLSKLAGLPGFKLAWTAVSGPADEVREASGRLEIIADSYLSAGTPVMNALPSLLPGTAAFVSATKARMAENLSMLREILERPGSPHRILRCEGGWTALVQSPRLESEEGLARRLLSEEGVWIHPGYFFDMEKEAYFAASLIGIPERMAECARRYAAMFERLLQDGQVP